MILRAVTLEDADLLLQWRNDPDGRWWSFRQEVVDRDEHVAWLHAALESPHQRLYMGEVNDRPVGVIRFTVRAQTAIVSILVDPMARGHGYATDLLQLGCDRLSDQGMTRFEAHVKPEHVRSQALFLRVGFREDERVFIRDV